MLLKMQVRLLLTISLIWQKALSSSYVCSSCRNPLPQSSSNIVFDRIHSQARTCEETLQSFLAETSKFDGALGPSAANGWHHGSREKDTMGIMVSSAEVTGKAFKAAIKPETRNAGY